MLFLIPLAILLLFSTNSFAHEQYTQARCDSIKAERERIHSRFRSGYSIRERDALNRRDVNLFQQLSRHCSNPVQPSANRANSNLQRQTNTTLQRSRVITRSPIKTNYTANNRVYTGAKADAWQEFYKVHDACRLRNPTHSDFVHCSKERTRQRREFEAQWRQTNPD